MPKAKELSHEDPKFLPTAYNLTEAHLNQLAEDYDPSLIPNAEIKGDDGYNFVHEKTMAITKVRTNIEKVRKDLKADALAWGKKVDGEAKRLTTIVEDLEAPWRDLKHDLDQKEAREKEEARQAEEKRIAEVEGRIAGIRGLAEGLLGADTAKIKERLAELDTLVLTEEEFGEYTEAAQVTGDIIRKTLSSALAEREAFEAQQADLEKQKAAMAEEQAAQQAKLAEQQAQLDAGKAEMERAQKEMDAEKAAEKAAQEARDKREAEDKAAIERADAEEKRLAEEAEAEEKRQAELAARLPEDQKLRQYADMIKKIPAPMIKDRVLSSVLSRAEDKLAEVISFIEMHTQESK